MKYQFGTCEIDVDAHQLVVNGVSIAVEPRVFELLRHIVENSDRLISHDELIEAVWKGRIVSDSAIAACISLSVTEPFLSIESR